MGHSISPNSVRKLRTEIGFSRQVNRKADEGVSHPDRSSSYCVAICKRHNWSSPCPFRRRAGSPSRLHHHLDLPCAHSWPCSHRAPHRGRSPDRRCVPARSSRRVRRAAAPRYKHARAPPRRPREWAAKSNPHPLLADSQFSPMARGHNLTRSDGFNPSSDGMKNTIRHENRQ